MADPFEPNESQELINRFRAQLKGPFSEIYFSEEELISIFDTAGDSDNDYIRQEALMVGARLYPDSVALLARRGIFYNQTDAEVFARFMEDHNEDSSSLIDVLKTENFHGTPNEGRALIHEMMERGAWDDDEFVIQFVRAAQRLGQVQWFIENFNDIRNRVQYKPTLLYEVGLVAEYTPELRPLAVKCLEELTETDPFIADFWSLLAYLYLLSGDKDKSASAIDYALAIDPNHTEALKGSLRLTDEKTNPDDITDLVIRILNTHPDTELLDSALFVARNMERSDLVCRLLDLIPATEIPGFAAVSCAIAADYPGMEDLINRALAGGVTAEEDWRSMLETAYYSHNSRAYNLILDAYASYVGTPLEHEYLAFINLWNHKDYEAAIELFQNADSTGTLRLAEHFYEGIIIFIVCLLRSGRTDHAIEMINGMLATIGSNTPLPGSRIERIGARRIITHIQDMLELDVPRQFWQDFDPFDIPE